MCECPAEEKCRFGRGNVHGVGHLPMQEKGFADMVKQHEHNHHAS